MKTLIAILSLAIPLAAMDPSVQLTPEQFGAVGDGVTSDDAAFARLTAAIHALDDIPGTVVVNLSHGKTYFFTEVAHGTELPVVELVRVTNLTFNGNGATIRVNGNIQSSHQMFTRSGIKLIRCNGVCINSLTLDGSSYDVDRGEHTEKSAFGIHVFGGEDITLTNVNSNDWMTDGFYVTSASGYGVPAGTAEVAKGIVMDSCSAKRNGRQGLSGTGQQIVCNTCVFADTGHGPYGGHAPSAGIDHEPNYDHRGINGIVSDAPNTMILNNCHSYHNAGGSFYAATLTANRTEINGGTYEGPTSGSSVGFGVVGDATIKDAKIRCDKTIWLGFSPGSAAVNDFVTKIDNCDIRCTSPLAYALYVGSSNKTEIANSRIELIGGGAPFKGGAYYTSSKNVTAKETVFTLAGSNITGTDPLAMAFYESSIKPTVTFATDFAGPGKVRIVGGELAPGITYTGNIAPF